MSKQNAVFIVAILLLLTVTCTARGDPSLLKARKENPEAEKFVGVEGASCQGAEDEEECLMQKSSVAHLDYIYTNDSHGR
ncbi:unnamed protein product [Coffea canephora]|uniref:Phytosulfokine n=1 Tax=Coffea canephora TaxID=49390 RepID=A0A068TXN6_COFCA|nr:phytosulfokines 3-like [Coffea arabica]CDP01021.1 unnamed protein product [Coffea canephora]